MNSESNAAPNPSIERQTKARFAAVGLPLMSNVGRHRNVCDNDEEGDAFQSKRIAFTT